MARSLALIGWGPHHGKEVSSCIPGPVDVEVVGVQLYEPLPLGYASFLSHFFSINGMGGFDEVPVAKNPRKSTGKMAPSPSVGETRQTLVKMAGDGPRDWTVIELQGLMEARDGTTVNGEAKPLLLFPLSST